MITILIITFVVAGIVAFTLSNKKKQKLQEEKSADQLAPEKIEPVAFVQEAIVIKEKKKAVKKTEKTKAEPKAKPVKKAAKKTAKK